MEKRNTALARVFATVALAGGCLVLAVVIATSIDAGSGGSKTPTSAGRVVPGEGSAKLGSAAGVTS